MPLRGLCSACNSPVRRIDWKRIDLPTFSDASSVVESRRHDSDTGSPDVQIAILTERIRHLTEHFKIHKHDAAGRRGLQAMVARRRKLLNYVAREDVSRYRALIQRLGLRR